jgi:hypothetical protein
MGSFRPIIWSPRLRSVSLPVDTPRLSPIRTPDRHRFDRDLRRTVVLLLKLYFRSRNRQGLHALNNRECPKSVAVSETPATPELELAARLNWRKAKQINSSASTVRNGRSDTLVWQVERGRDGVSWKSTYWRRRGAEPMHRASENSTGRSGHRELWKSRFTLCDTRPQV